MIFPQERSLSPKPERRGWSGFFWAEPEPHTRAPEVAGGGAAGAGVGFAPRTAWHRPQPFPQHPGRPRALGSPRLYCVSKGRCEGPPRVLWGVRGQMWGAPRVLWGGSRADVGEPRGDLRGHVQGQVRGTPRCSPGCPGIRATDLSGPFYSFPICSVGSMVMGLWAISSRLLLMALCACHRRVPEGLCGGSWKIGGNMPTFIMGMFILV